MSKGLLFEIRSRARYVIGPVLGISAMGYVAFHAVQGDRGLIAWLKINQQVAAAGAEAAETAAARAALERRVGLLNPASLDPDMLDERARLMLNYGLADEIVIPLSPAAQ